MNMDAAESDHSMTWEDFFGSTTDLTPTLIGIYDSLLVPDEANKPAQKKLKKIEKQTVEETNDIDLNPQTSDLRCEHKTDKSKHENKMEQPKDKTPRFKLPLNSINRNQLYIRRTGVNDVADKGAVNEGNNTSFLYKTQGNVAKKEVNAFDSLSPNVKRMLESADANTVSTLKQKKIVRASMRGPKCNIPLVGVTSKISQSGVDILDSVEIYDQPAVNKIEDPKIPEKTKAPPPETLPNFKIDPTNDDSAIYDVPRTKTAFESLSLPFIDQSLEISPSNNYREFETKIKTPPEIDKGNKDISVKNKNIPETFNAEFKSKTEIGGILDKTNKNELYADDIRSSEKESITTVTRPLSMSSIASSSSTSSSGVQNKGINSAYLASIESLDDHSDDMASNKGSNSFVNSTGDINMGNLDNTDSKDGERCVLSLLERVCAEIVETENVYVEDLRQVVEGYLHVWTENRTFSAEDLALLFNNIEEIYAFNRSLCDGLNTCLMDPISLARQFVDNTSGFAVYASYCTGYPQTMSRLASLMACPVGAAECRARQAALQHALPLGSYLLKPVQRILKYHLLLQNLVKQCRSAETEYALRQMTAIAQHIDDMKRKHEHAVRVQEIQSLLYGWNGPDLTTYGELCAEGTFRVFGAKAVRHAFLFDTILLLTKSREDGILAYKSHIMCNNLMLVESIDGAPLSFHVIPWDNPRAQLTLQARSQRHKREWTLLLKRVILENYNAVIPSHARQLVMELGQNKTDDDILAEKSRNLITHASMRKQLSAPEYLEKRKLDRERRKTCENRLKPARLTAVKSQCDCAQVSIERGTDFTCDKCYVDLCSDCDAEMKEKECNCVEAEKCPECDKSLQFIDAGSAENLERRQGSCKCDFKSSQDIFAENATTLTNRAYHSSDNIASYSEKGMEVKGVLKTCLKCAKIKENIVNENKHERKSRVNEQENKKDTIRSKSKDDPQRTKLSKISTWRRKSEPGLDNGINIASIIAKKNNENEKEADGCEKIEFECRNCGSTKISRKQKRKHEKVATDSDQSSTKGKFSLESKQNTVEVQKYNTKHVPKKISKLRKSRAKGLRLGSDMTAKFYTDFSTDVSTENILHISESTDSLNDLTKHKNEAPPISTTKHDIDIDEETYKKLIEKTDSFKKNELEKGKYLNQQKVIKEGTESESDKQSEPEKRHKEEESEEESEKPLEQIISQLLMQNREFQKILKKQQQRSGANRRNQRLLKSHSNPEDPTALKNRDQNKVRPKYGRQTSENFKRSPTGSPRLSPSKDVQSLSEEEHIYEKLRIESKKQTTESKIPEQNNPPIANKNKHLTGTIQSTVDSDYVYLSFDKVKQYVTDDSIYDVPSSIPVKKPVQQTDYYVTVNNKKSNDNIYDRVDVRVKERENNITTGDYLPMNKDQQNPNAPEIWLNRQKEHFNVSRDRKSGSLPRSFQVGDPSIDEKGLVTFKGKTNIPSKTYLNKDGKVMSTDRPFTIASDKSEISYEDVSTYMSENDVLKYRSNKNTLNEECISKSTLDLEEEIDRCYKNNFERNIDDSKKHVFVDSQQNINASVNSSCEVLTQPIKQIDEVDQVHPEHKIYKPTTNFSIRHVLGRFKNKSPHKNTTQDDEKGQFSNEQSPEITKIDPKNPTSNEKRSALNPRSYSKNLLQRFKSIIADEHPENNNVKRIHKTSAPLAVDEISQNKQSDLTVIMTPNECNQKALIQKNISPTTDIHKKIEKNTFEEQSVKPKFDTLQHSFENIKQSDPVRPTYDKSVSVISTSSTSSSPSKTKIDKNKLPIYKQGSKLLGARIAQSDYVDPKTLNKIDSNIDLNNFNVLINRNSIRPDSLLSTSSFLTSSSEGNQVEQTKITSHFTENEKINNKDRIKIKMSAVDSSDDSFYEKPFEKLEHVIDEKICADLPLHSDRTNNDSTKLKAVPISSPQRNIPRLEKIKASNSYKSEISTSYHKTELKSDVLSTNNTKDNFDSLRQKIAPPLPVKPKLIAVNTNKSFIYPKPSVKPSASRNEFSESQSKSSQGSNITFGAMTSDSTKSSESLSVSEKSNTESLSRSESINSDAESVKSRITFRYHSIKSVDESVSSNKSTEGNNKPRSSLHSIHMKQLERKSLDSSLIKTENDKLSEDTAKNTSRSVLERRLEIESMTKGSPLRTSQRTLPKPKQFNRPIAQKTSLQRSLSGDADKNVIPNSPEKRYIPKAGPSVLKETTRPSQDEGRSVESVETSWVKTIVNKFQ